MVTYQDLLEGTWEARFLIGCAVRVLINSRHNPKYHVGYSIYRLPEQVPLKRY